MTRERVSSIIAATTVLALLVAGCTSTDTNRDSGSTTVVDTTTTTAPNPTTSSTPPTTSGSPPTSLPAPDLADPFDLADEGLPDITGYRYVPGDFAEDRFASVEARLAGLVDALFAAVTYDGMIGDADGEEVMVASFYPYPEFRGDPTLAPSVAASVLDFIGDPEEVRVDDQLAFVVTPDQDAWYFWASNTNLLVVVGERDVAASAMGALIGAQPVPYRWEAGDCLYFPGSDTTSPPYAPFGHGEIVPCTGTHTHEVIFSETLPEPADAPYPGEELFERRDRSCSETYELYVGIGTADSKVGLVSYMPDPAEWDEGDRYLACMVAETTSSGLPRPRTDLLASLGDAVRIERSAGDCHAVDPFADPVPCSVAHEVEYLGPVMLAGDAGDPWPGYDSVDSSAARSCDALLEGYAWKTSDGTADVFAYPVAPGPFEWDRGERQVRCFAFATDADGSVAVVGSFAEDWKSLGPNDGGITA